MSDAYESACKEIELFDSLVIDVIKSSRDISVPLNLAQDKSIPVEVRASEAYTALIGCIHELVQAGVNPTPALRSGLTRLTDCYLNPATGREIVGSPEPKHLAAVQAVSAGFKGCVYSESLSKDLQDIL